MSPLSGLVSIAGKVRRPRKKGRTGWRDPVRYRNRMREYMRKRRAMQREQRA